MSRDEELYQDVRRGRREAFDTLYARHERKLFGFVMAHVKDRQDAEEIFQETFQKLILVASGQGGEEPRHVEAWLYTVARRLCLNRIRARRPADPGLDAGDVPDPTPGGEDALLARKRAKSLAASVERLPANLSEVYRLRVQGDDYETMARKLGVPLGTVKSRVHALVARLRKELAEWLVS